MIFNRLTEEAESAAIRYGLLTEAWRSIFLDALNSSDFGTPAQLARAVEEAFAIASDYIAEERRDMARVIAEIAQEARRATLQQIESIDASERSERISEHLSASQHYVESELIAQMHRDIALLRQHMQRVTLEVALASTSRGVSERMALIEYRIGNQDELKFVFHDRHARKWASKKFVRAMWRHALLSVYNEIVLITLAEHGISRAQIVNQDTGAATHRMIIAMGSNAEFPTYSEIRGEIFHPNANAVLVMEGKDVPA